MSYIRNLEFWINPEIFHPWLFKEINVTFWGFTLILKMLFAEIS